MTAIQTTTNIINPQLAIDIGIQLQNATNMLNTTSDSTIWKPTGLDVLAKLIRQWAIIQERAQIEHEFLLLEYNFTGNLERAIQKHTAATIQFGHQADTLRENIMHVTQLFI